MGVSCCNNPDIVENVDVKKLLNQYSKLYAIKNDYEMLSIVGSGSFGKVRVSRGKIVPSTKFAVKTMKKEGIDKPLFNCFKNEVNILRCVDHPYIVNFIESYESDGFIHIVTEFLGGFDLQKLILLKDEEEYKYEEGDVCLVAKEILRALKYLHGQKIVHRDMKPENIHFGQEKRLDTLKVIDFGLATYIGTHDKKSCGSPYYMVNIFIK